MKILKGIIIAVFVLVILLALFIGFVSLCKWQNWLPNFVDPVVKFFNDCGITFFNKIK